MTADERNKEVSQAKPKPLETVTDFISKKDNERQSDGMNKVMEQVGAIQEGVGEVMAGVEAFSDKVSEKKGETGEKGDIRTGGQPITGDDQQTAQQIRSGLTRRALPKEEIMVKKIRTAINFQIKEEFRNAFKLEKNLVTGSAQEYNVRIARIRRLKETLASLFHNTMEKIKEMYTRYFSTDGRRKSSE